MSSIKLLDKAFRIYFYFLILQKLKAFKRLAFKNVYHIRKTFVQSAKTAKQI